MTDPFVAEIRIFAFNFAPRGWALSDGQLLPISQNTAIFSLVGTFYGGDGASTFALPDLQGNLAVHQGQGPALSQYFLGQEGGSSSVSLLESEIPAHSHGMVAANTVGTLIESPGNHLGKGQSGNPVSGTTQARMYTTVAPNTTLNPAQGVGIAGGSLPHNNMMPYLTLNFCFALQGVFPPRG